MKRRHTRRKGSHPVAVGIGTGIGLGLASLALGFVVGRAVKSSTGGAYSAATFPILVAVSAAPPIAVYAFAGKIAKGDNKIGVQVASGTAIFGAALGVALVALGAAAPAGTTAITATAK